MRFYYISRSDPVSTQLTERSKPFNRATRGTTLIEVLIASAVMAMLMVGVLQLFSLALITNIGSATRTDLTYRAQQVIENLRLIQYFAKDGNVVPATAAGVATAATGASGAFTIAPPADGKPVAISNTSAFWKEAGVVVDKDDPFRVSYLVTDISGAGAPGWGANYYTVTVTAAPVDAPDFDPGTGAVAASSDTRYYLGGGKGGYSTNLKRVDYVGQIPR